MTGAEVFGFAFVVAAAAAVPGPDIAAIFARTLGVGFTRSLPLIIGIILGHAVWMLAAVSGLAALAQLLGPAFIGIKIAAASYLIYLAWRLWTAASTTDVADDRTVPDQRNAIVTGLLVSFSNPRRWSSSAPWCRASSRSNGSTAGTWACSSSRTPLPLLPSSQPGPRLPAVRARSCRISPPDASPIGRPRSSWPAPPSRLRHVDTE